MVRTTTPETASTDSAPASARVTKSDYTQTQTERRPKAMPKTMSDGHENH